MNNSTKLPDELVYLISEFLPASCALRFSLSNKYIYDLNILYYSLKRKVKKLLIEIQNSGYYILENDLNSLFAKGGLLFKSIGKIKINDISAAIKKYQEIIFNIRSQQLSEAHNIYVINYGYWNRYLNKKACMILDKIKLKPKELTTLETETALNDINTVLLYDFIKDIITRDSDYINLFRICSRINKVIVSNLIESIVRDGYDSKDIKVNHINIFCPNNLHFPSNILKLFPKLKSINITLEEGKSRLPTGVENLKVNKINLVYKCNNQIGSITVNCKEYLDLLGSNNSLEVIKKMICEKNIESIKRRRYIIN